METSSNHWHFLDRKIGIYNQYVIELVKKTTFRSVREGFPTLILPGLHGKLSFIDILCIKEN